MTGRGGRVVALGLALGLCASCAGRRAEHASQPEHRMGIYGVRLERPEGKPRKFKLWLYAEPPDRLHGEIVTPVGTTALVLDGGAGRLSVTFVRDRMAFVGPAEPAALERLLGVRLGLTELVGALLGEIIEAEGVEVQREATAAGVLPTHLAIVGAARRLELKLIRLRPVNAGPELGTGAPPQGMELRDLDELRLDEIEARLPLDESAG